jgi:hypothetical protein
MNAHAPPTYTNDVSPDLLRSVDAMAQDFAASTHEDEIR